MYQYPRYIRKKGDLHDKIYFLERQRPAGRHEERLPGYLPGPRRRNDKRVPANPGKARLMAPGRGDPDPRVYRAQPRP